ncbi:HemK2/MTQ2 family protein methyltransferase [Rhodococcus koreensis]|uniref:Release factor glutamine methyltransferase n=1 Tax=Rhodococcus koreensis TaxID=99653 RepID=A0A1H5EU30_9NOCA|nr:HemK2/MTQ2 family protein methyltransferase [Rhodococcus koreensis]SED94631.1 release factor glutamine methyltransferase [Rhodococcus koreensis]
MLLRLPGVYPPQADTELLARALASEDLGPTSQVLDLCTGTGRLSLQAAALGAGHVTAVDLSRRAVFSTWINATMHRDPIRVLYGDLTAPVKGEQFDLVISNPPYVPAQDDTLPNRGPQRAWDAGRNGRALLDRICAEAPAVLASGGVLLLTQSSLSGIEQTRSRLEDQGLSIDIAARFEIHFGPVLSSRRTMLETRGLITTGQTTEELVVIRAVK